MSQLTLSDIAQIVDCEHKTAPSTIGEPFGYSVGTRALNGHGINLSECKPVSQETYLAWSRRAELVQGDIIFAREAPVGGLGLVNGKTRLCLGQRTVLIRPNPTVVDSNYLYYLLSSEKCQRQMIEMSTGTTVLHINVADVRNFKLDELPRIEIQRAIGKVLFQIEQKIEVNQQIASTLEQIAKTIFKSWFVDFDPVHAKARGEQPVGMDADTAALFPDSFEDSELGPIPSGWKPELLGSLVELTKGKSYKSIELEPSDVALVTLKSFKRGGGYRHDGLKAYSGKFKESQVIRSGDLIVAMTDVTQAADVVGKPAIVASTGKYSELVASLDVGIIRPKSQSVTKNFLYFLFLTTEFDAQVRAHASGTTVLHLGADAIPSFPMCLPSQEVINAFSEIVNPCIAQIDSLSQQNSNLVEIRDALLPRLISGELEIPAELLEA